MSQFLRLLLLTPALFTPVLSLVMSSPAHANPAWVPVSKELTCARVVNPSAMQLVCKRVSGKDSESGKVIDLMTLDGNAAQSGAENPDRFDFTDEESNTAVALFGCDCPVCIGSLRKLRSMVPASV
ncbi:MAG: hypothetical protein HC866_21555 [Leptolyngbyaceae cyanobacterium RU_5_1]|nr:hypothetical protein [Leptolyngbyaceae cyanobacterium RU_5_1]